MFGSALPSIFLAGFISLATCIHANTESSQAISLFDGESLKGWKNIGGGNFYIENGTIVGETKTKLPNSFLATEKMYDNFELEVEFKVDPILNSGIQIRSHVYTEDTETIRWGGTFDEEGKKLIKNKLWPKGRLWGYQIEIDPTERAWTGTLYEEAGRGFLHTPGENKEAMKAFKQGEWNHFRIIADGDHFQTWLNGVPVVDMHDSLTATGYIALQLHGIGKKKEKAGKKVQWRNIKLRDLNKK